MRLATSEARLRAAEDAEYPEQGALVSVKEIHPAGSR